MSDKHTDAQGELQRYSLTYRNDFGDKYGADADEDSDGEWVRYSDVEAKIRATEGQAQTSEAVKLPPLPEPEEMDGARWGYTADQMNSHGEDCANAVAAVVQPSATVHALHAPAEPSWNEKREQLQAELVELALDLAQHTGCMEFSLPVSGTTPQMSVSLAAQLADSTAPGAPVEDARSLKQAPDLGQGEASTRLWLQAHGYGNVTPLHALIDLSSRIAKFTAAPTVQQSLTAGGAMPEGYLIAPHYRGYADLGTGQYVLNHSGDGEAPELIISVATDEQKAGRAVGERRINKPDALLDPDVMAVRIRFSSATGLDALEFQLRDLRAAHFPTAAVSPRAADAPSEPSELPHLPKEFGEIDVYHDDGRVHSVSGYTADQMRGYAIDYAFQLGISGVKSRAADALDSQPSGKSVAQWLRNHYQDYPNIASLCDALEGKALDSQPTFSQVAGLDIQLEHCLARSKKWASEAGLAEKSAREMRAAFHVNMLRAYPEKSHSEIAAEIDRAAGTEPCFDERVLRIGRNMVDYAKRAGWPDNGEGAFEFLQRKFYEAGAATIQEPAMVAEPVSLPALLQRSPDPRVWAREFCKRNPSCQEVTVAGWFKLALAAPMVAEPAGVEWWRVKYLCKTILAGCVVDATKVDAQCVLDSIESAAATVKAVPSEALDAGPFTFKQRMPPKNVEVLVYAKVGQRTAPRWYLDEWFDEDGESGWGCLGDEETICWTFIPGPVAAPLADKTGGGE